MCIIHHILYIMVGQYISLCEQGKSAVSSMPVSFVLLS